MGGDAAGGVITILGAQPLARLVDVGVDGVFGVAEPAADLLGAQVFIDEPQALTFPGCEKIDGRIRRP
jgi:hypothetical protein